MEQIRYEFDKLNGFKPSTERISSEITQRKNQKLLSFGVSFLDDALIGITRDDLIVLGSKTGTGKTQLASIIARRNAEKGVRVHYFALEASDSEIESRIKYQLISQANQLKPAMDKIKLDYTTWAHGLVDTDHLENECEGEFKEKFKTLNTYYRGKNFDIDEFERLFISCASETDLVIVDHLHYFDIEDSNENRGTKDIVKRMRDVGLRCNIPIILIAHLRKSDKYSKVKIPSLDEFHGSSDITKIATKVITLAPCGDDFDYVSGKAYTYMRILKFRKGGNRVYMPAVVLYDFREQDYLDTYWLARLEKGGEQVELIKKIYDIPEWAKRAKISTK